MRYGCSMVLLFLMSGCQTWSSTAQTATVNVLYQGAQCGRNETSMQVSWLSTEQAHGRFGAKSLVGDSVQRLLLIELGRKPTPGYRLNSLDSKASVEDGRLRLVLEWVSPAADRLQAQMITSPCTLLGLPESGYREVDLVDSQGSVVLSVSR